MPLPFEVKNQESILCFVPSGHRVGDEFVDLPKQEGYTCWYSATNRLISMCHTQKGFSLADQSRVSQAVSSLRDKLVTTFYMTFFCNYLVQVLFISHATEHDQVLKALKALTSASSKNTLLNIAKEGSIEPRIAESFATLHFEEFKQNCINIATLVKNTQSTLPNVTMQDKITDCVRKYIMQKDNKMYEEFFALLCVRCNLTERDLKELADAREKNSELKNTIYHNCMWQLYMRENHIETTFLSTEMHRENWGHMIRDLLENKGPVIMAGYVGCGYYDSPAKDVGKLRSLKLLGFPKDSYKPIEIAHTVVIIGMTKDKVIFLDPARPPPVNEPRNAYIMNINTFMARVVEFQEKIFGPDVLPCYYLDPARIDITSELMHAQIGLSGVDEVAANLSRASLKPGKS